MRKRVLDPCNIIRIQNWDIEAQVPSAVEDILGVAWPKEAGTVASGQVDTICVGPTDWLVLAAHPKPSPLLHQLDVLLQGSTFRAIDVSQTLVRVQIEGPEARDLLAKGCSLDLHAPLFPPEHSARTRFAGIPVIVRCIRHSTFEILVTLSYADYLMAWMEDAGLEFSGTAA